MSLRQRQVLQELLRPERLQLCQQQELQERLLQVQRRQRQELLVQQRLALQQQELPVQQQQVRFQQVLEQRLLLSCCKQRVQQQPSGMRSTESFS
jgi:hypothetical protein